MARAMKEFHPELRPGDAFLHNSPYHGNSHAADHTHPRPGRRRRRQRTASPCWPRPTRPTAATRSPPTYIGAARDVYEEGALIFPGVQVQQDYEDSDDVVRMCKMRIRVPEQWWGDYLAMIGAARIGEREL